jgi:hypothetical protein
MDQDTRRHDTTSVEPQTTNPKSTIETEITEAEKDDDEMQEDSNSDNAVSHDLSDVSTGPSPATKMSPAPSVEAVHTLEDNKASNHIPLHVFSNILIELLIDQNSNLASLAQQCIVSVAYQLTNITNAETAPESESILPSVAQKLLDAEIIDGIINGLLSIAGRIKTALYQSSCGENGSQSSVGSPDSQNNNQKAVFQMSDDIDQGEINLCKMVSLSVSVLLRYRIVLSDHTLTHVLVDFILGFVCGWRTLYQDIHAYCRRNGKRQCLLCPKRSSDGHW